MPPDLLLAAPPSDWSSEPIKLARLNRQACTAPMRINVLVWTCRTSPNWDPWRCGQRYDAYARLKPQTAVGSALCRRG